MGIGLGVATVVNLLHGLGSGTIEFILKDVNILRSFYHAVGTAVRRCLLAINRVAATADESHDEINRILELPLVTFLTIALPHRVWNTGQEIVKQTAKRFGLTMVEGAFFIFVAQLLGLCVWK